MVTLKFTTEFKINGTMLMSDQIWVKQIKKKELSRKLLQHMKLSDINDFKSLKARFLSLYDLFF